MGRQLNRGRCPPTDGFVTRAFVGALKPTPPVIRGDLLRNGTLPEIKLFLAMALSGMARGFQQQRTTVWEVSCQARHATQACLALLRRLTRPCSLTLVWRS